MQSRRQRTHERLIECALDLFESQGYEQTTVAQIAAAAEVQEMTFFRHFSRKEGVVLTDPYDPAMVAGIAAQPTDLAPLVRAAAGVRQVLGALPEPETSVVRRRVRVIAASPALRASSAVSNQSTETHIRDQLVVDGATPLAAGVAAAALMAALTAALYAWAGDDQLSLTGTIAAALTTLAGADD